MDCTALCFDDGIVTHACLGIAFTDQHTDDTRSADLIGDRSGGGSKNIDEVFFTFCLDRHVLCPADNCAVTNCGIGIVSGNSCRKSTACRGSLPCHVHGGGEEDQVRKVLRQNIDAAFFRVELCAIAHGGIYVVSGEDNIQRAADCCRALFSRNAENTSHGDSKNIVLCFRTDADIIVGGNTGILAHACVYLASVIKAGNVHPNTCRAGGSQRAADDTAVHAALRLNRGLAAVKDDDCTFVYLCTGSVMGKEH